MEMGYENAGIMFKKEKDSEGSYFMTIGSCIFYINVGVCLIFWCLDCEDVVVMHRQVVIKMSFYPKRAFSFLFFFLYG